MSRRRLLSRLVWAALLAVGTGLVMSGTASAHDVLISSSPQDGSTISVVPTEVTFTFDQPVQNFDPVVSLVGPDGRQYASGTPSISGNVVTGTVGGGPAGAYIAAYRIVSADGHPVTGEIHFTLAGGSGAAPASGSGHSTAPGGSTPSADGSPAAAVATAGGQGSAGLSAGLWIGLIVAAAAVIGAAGILLRRPSRGRDY